jgi:gliding-associated putative ABC transporter substrate-binding component GldG
MKQAKNALRKRRLLTIGGLVLLNVAAGKIFMRFDLTQDKRYTLSKTSLQIVQDAKEPLYVDVFLKGDFPGEFKKLQAETNQLLEEFKAQNPEIKFRFGNPMGDGNDYSIEEKKDLIFDLFELNAPKLSQDQENEVKNSIDKVDDIDRALTDSFTGNGLLPVSVTVNDRGKQSEQVVFPWAIARYGNRVVKIPLLKTTMGGTTEQKVVNSVQYLEYAFANGFNTVLRPKKKSIVIIKGNGELGEPQIADFLREARTNYFLAPFTLDSVAKQPSQTLEHLKRYDLAIIAKPTEKFSDEEKEVLDQYVMSGGKTIWLIDQVNAEMDSLYNDGTALAFPNDLNLNDLFFKYGVRLHPSLVKDLMAAPIALATGEQGSATQYTQYPWFYSPLVYPAVKHPVVTNLDGVKFEFANPIELLKNDVKKTVLLRSSPYSKAVGTPSQIDLKMVEERPQQSEFTGQGSLPVAVLLEGKFRSVYQNRVLPFSEKTFMPESRETQMIVVSDGDLIKNQFDKNYQPLELGYDKWTNKLYANKEFLMNCVNYLLDDNGLINIRGKQVSLAVLDKEKVYANYTATQVLTVGLPMVLLAVFGILFTWLRRRRYAR